MNDHHLQAHQAFIATHRKKLAWIARRTNNEYQREDVETEAWLLAQELASKDATFDLSNPDCQDHLLARLYNKLVKFAETNVRYGVRLDHGNDEDDCHPLLRKLTADGGADPLATALQAEDHTPDLDDPQPHHSRAASYLWLLRHFDGRMRSVAEYLLISTSYCYRCCKRAHHIAETQWPLPALQPSGTTEVDEPPLKPWRPFRIGRRTVQLELPFCVNHEIWHDSVP